MADLEQTVRPEDLYARLNASPKGLSAQEAAQRLDSGGPNALPERKENPFWRVFKHFWGPIPWMIEAAGILSGLVRHWADLAIIGALLLFNALISIFEEHKAANALAALRSQLALKARVLRDGNWQEIAARELVVGDVIRIRLGDVIPADAVLIQGEYLSIDQAALTGESLPVSKGVGQTAYSGSVAKQGEMVAMVSATGGNTFFGHTAQLVQAAGCVSHFQRAIISIGNRLIYMTLGLVAVLVLVGLHRQEPPLELLQFALILTVAAIPVAMPAVLSVTMAVGALALSRMKAIVSRLESIEEMAGMDVLCSDKTGTLTQNRLSLGSVWPVSGVSDQELLEAAAWASRAENNDAIDLAVLAGVRDKAELEVARQTAFTPFDPVHKRTEARLSRNGKVFRVTKGAPRVVLELCQPEPRLRQTVLAQVDEAATKGMRTLGVAWAEGAGNGDGSWRFLGVLALYDPPREDSAETIRKARAHGIQVKMITGDDTSIGREIAEELGIGAKIRPAAELMGAEADASHLSARAQAAIDAADGFAQVFPEHKFGIVKALQDEGHVVGMTGDGVNDAPALKQADVGVAVSGATDAARAAADLVLTEPGLSVIVSAVEEARRIFERMNSYAIYRITETIRIMIFVVLAMLVYRFYPITAVMIILLALLNDIPIMTIAYDRTWLPPKPVSWEMRRVFTVAMVLGGIGVVETFGLLIYAERYLHLDHAAIQSFIFLKLAVAGHLTLFVARTKRPFLTRPFPAWSMLASALVTKALATAVCVFGWFVAPLTWQQVGLIWGYCIVWVFIEDAAKLMVYRFMRHEDAGTIVGASRHGGIPEPPEPAVPAVPEVPEVPAPVAPVEVPAASGQPN